MRMRAPDIADIANLLDIPDEHSPDHRVYLFIIFFTLSLYLSHLTPVSGLMIQMEGSDNAYSRGDKWRLTCVEGKGMGVIATADIKQGKPSLIMIMEHHRRCHSSLA